MEPHKLPPGACVRAQSIDEIRRRLAREGYDERGIAGRSLRLQLRLLIATATKIEN